MVLGNYLDFAKNELRNARIQNLASAPSSPVAGQAYYNTANNAAYIYNGSTWQVADAVLATNIPNTALATNPLARANHTGTQLFATISDGATTVKGYSLDMFAAPAADVSWNSHKITNLLDPVSAQDAATKNYVDTNIQLATQGIVSKPAVAVVSVANQASLSGLLTIDGHTLVAGDRILLTGQTTTSQNGVWVAASGAWARAAGDADGNNDLAIGATWFVAQGTTYAASTWRLATPTSGTITPGTTGVTITQLAQATTYTASLGVQIVGSDIRANYGSGLTLSGNQLIIDRTKVPNIFSANIGDGSTTAIVVTHSLGTTDIIAVVRDASGNVITTDWQATSTTTATFTFAVAPTTNQYRVTIMG